MPLPAQPPPMSERDLWQDVRDVAHELERGLVPPKAAARSLYDLAMVALSQLGRGVHANPDLAIVSLGMNPPRGRWDTVERAQAHRRAAEKEGDTGEAARWAARERELRGNPSGEVFGSDVLAIVYQHNEDRSGDVRVHTFGGTKEAKWRETARGVEVYDLPRTTGVYMSAEGDKRVVMQHRRGLPLVQEL